jgi:polysaccharide biosynthesis/export protein
MQPARLGATVVAFTVFALLATLALAPPGSAQTVETAQQTNERIRALATTSHAPPSGDYVIGSGDLVSIQVFDVPELSRELRVSRTGTIGIPLIPVRLNVAGLTEVQAERKIEEVLQAQGLVSHPEVSVTVKEKKSRPITIVGAVGHPRVYSADRQVTLIEALAEAGGIAGDAGDTVIITRPDPSAASDSSDPPEIGPQDTQAATALAAKPDANSAAPPIAPVAPATADQPASSGAKPDALAQAEPPGISPASHASTITVNLNQILETGDMQNNVVLQPGDVVTVPHAGIVYVLGAVGRPGGYTVSHDPAQLTALKVLSLAGGLSRTAKSTRAVIVRKDTNGQQQEVEVDLRKVMKFEAEDVRLRPSDILYVPTSGAKQSLIRLGELSMAVGTGVLIYRLVP